MPTPTISLHIASVVLSPSPVPGGVVLKAKVSLVNDGGRAHTKYVATTLIGPTDRERENHEDLPAKVRKAAVSFSGVMTEFELPAHQPFDVPAASVPIGDSFFAQYQSGQAFFYVDFFFWERVGVKYIQAQDVCIVMTGPSNEPHVCPDSQRF